MKYKIAKKWLACVLCAVFIGFSVNADVTLRTASGQEVYLTDSQWQNLLDELASVNGLLVEIVYGSMGSSVGALDANVLEMLNQLYFLTTTIPSDVAQGVSDGYFNLENYSVVYSNLLSRYLTAYTNNLYSQISALDTSIFSTNFLRRNFLVNKDWLENEMAQYDIYYTFNALGNLYNNVDTLRQIWLDDLTDSNTVQNAYYDFLRLITDVNDTGNEPAYIIQRAGFMGMQQFQKMYSQQQDYIDRVTAGFTLGMFDVSTGSVVPFGSPYFDNRFNDDYLGFVQNDFLNGRSFTAIFQEGTNLLERISRSSVPDTVKQKMSDNIIQKLIQANTLQGKNDFEGLKDALQGMAEAMSNCCANTGFLPLIYEGVSNIVEGIGNDYIGGGAGGSDSNGLANLEFPLGFPPSETNDVPYTFEWARYTVDNSQFGRVGEVEYALNRNNQVEHNRKAENVGSNITHRVIPIIDKFKTYSQGFSRSTPPQNISIIDTSPISSFARYHANTDVDFGSDGGILDLTWINEKICIPFHKFFTIFWVLLAAFLIISSWIFFFRKFMSFRTYFIKLWDVIKNVFK